MKDTKNEVQISKPKILNWNNVTPAKGEVNSGEILVEPDQAYTLKEILAKFTKGIALPITNQDATYQNTDDFDEIDTRQLVKDYADIPELSEAIKHKRLKKAKQGEGQNDKTSDEVRGTSQQSDAQSISEAKEP